MGRPNPGGSTMRTRLTEACGIRHPIVCAPMGLVTGGRLAAAVSAAGGLGIIGGGYAGTLGGEPDLHAELAHVQGQTFGVGFITWALARAPRALDAVLPHRPACVFLSFGDPRPFAERIRRAGARLVCQAQNLAHIDAALTAGAPADGAPGGAGRRHRPHGATPAVLPPAAGDL